MKPRRTRRNSRAIPRAQGRRLWIETLESRALLTIQPLGGEFQVNSLTAGDQRLGDAPPYATASDADGDRVMVWSSFGQDGDGWGVFGQRYSATGSPAGSEFRVNSTTAGDQSGPVVAMDADGDFVVAWTSGDGDGKGVFAQRFSSSGARLGLEFRVNLTVVGDQAQPAVASDAAGNFVVAWSSLQDGDQGGIVARRFDAHGAPLAGEISVNLTTAGNQFDPVVAMNLRGEFAVAWVSDGQDGDGAGIVARRFGADGVALGGEIAVNQFHAGAQTSPAIAIESSGAFAVAWQSAGQDLDGSAIVARRFTADGTPAADEIIVNTTTAGDQSRPAIAIGVAGEALVAWTSEGQDGDAGGVFAQAISPGGALVNAEFYVNTTTAGDQRFPSLAFDRDGDVAIVWHSAAQDGDGLGVFAQRFSQELVDLAAPLVTGVNLAGDPHRLAAGSRLVSAPSQLVVAFSEAMSEADGASGAGSVLNPANYRLTLFGADYSDHIAGVAYGFNSATNRHEAALQFSAPLPAGMYRLTALESIEDVAGNRLDGEFDGLPGGAWAMDFEVARMSPAGLETAVNSSTNGDQAFVAGAPGTIASDDAGNYVITWSSLGQDGSGWGVYAQRFAADGTKLGGEFLVNTYTANHQRYSSVAMDADGDFVITWSSLGQDGGNYGVYAQRYNATGSRVGDEFRVNTTTNKFQGRSSVAMDDDGDFVVAWESVDQDGSGVGVYFQRYASDGAKRGGETHANSITLNAQRLPNVAMDADGDFVITWSGPPDGSGYGIFARRFNADGVAQGVEFLANTLTAGNQQDSTVAMDADGDFVVAWHSSTGDGVFYGIYAQRFTAQGEKLGGQFLVNTFTDSFQQYPSVAMDDDGDFVIAWQSLTQDGSIWGVYGQRYSWAGGRDGGEFQIHTTTLESQTAPNATMTPRGDFIVAWQSNLQDGGGWGVYSQRYAGELNQAPTASAGGPYFIAEGDGVTLDAGGSTEADFGQSLSYAWDLDNDGEFDDAVGASPRLSAAELAALGLADDGEFPIAVRVDDGFGGASVATTTLTVQNVAPSAVVLEPLPPTYEGAELVLAGAFADPGALDRHTLEIDWGDGVVESFAMRVGARTFAIPHVVRNDAPTGTAFDLSSVRVVVRDDDGGASYVAETAVELRNVAPTLQDLQFSKIVLDEGESFTITGRVEDAGAADTHTVTFHWAVGVAQVVDVDSLTRTFSVTYAYPDDIPGGTDQDLTHFTFTLADDDLGEATVPAAVTVRNVAPVFQDVVLSADAINEGDDVTVSGALFDPGLLDALSLMIDWGEGNVESVTVDPITRTFSASHTYADDQPSGAPADVYAITLVATDDDLGVAQYQRSVTVNNQAPTAEIVIAPAEPTPLRELVLAAIMTDAGADTFSYRWELWLGDQIVANGALAELRYTPQAIGEYRAALQVTDDDGGQTTVERTFTVRFRPGDTNGDGLVDIVDLNKVRNYFGASRGDVEWQNYIGPIPGDANGDDVVDIQDLNLVRNHFGESGPSPAPSAVASTGTPSSTPRRNEIVLAAHRVVDAVFAQLAAVEERPLLRRGRSR